MPTQLQIDILTTAHNSVVAIIGASNNLSNNSFETFSTGPPTFASWTTLNSPIIDEETVIVYDGVRSLSWSHDGIGNRPSIHQLFSVQDSMKGATLKISGKIRSSTSATQTLSMSIGINNASSPTLVLPNGSENEDVEVIESGTVFNFQYDNSKWYEFSYYYHVPESGVNLVGPVLFPTASDSTTEIFLDDIVAYFELSNRSERWRIDLDPIEKPFYGYGYGNYFVNDSFVPFNSTYDYFNVIGILGDNVGFGVTESINDGELPDDLYTSGYNYGFGYEYVNAILANGSDSITIKATVFENNITQPNIRMVIKGSPGIKIISNTDVTDDFGNVYFEVSLDPDVVQNTIRTPGSPVLSSVPFNGWLKVYAEVAKDPREMEGFSIIRTQSIQLTETSIDIFDISTYSFSSRYSYTYGFEDYGYWPF